MGLVTPVEPVPVDKLGSVYMIGIGGVGMSGIAGVLVARGVPVAGSDGGPDSPVVDELRAAGVRVHTGGHAAGRLGDAETVIVSSAIRADNPELVEARSRGLRVLPRAAALGALLLDRRGIAVAGTHGKTTTTAMLTAVAAEAGADPGYVIGGRPAGAATGYAAGGGEVFVAEADESDGSLLMLAPHAAVVTNIEADHLDNYTGIEQIVATFDAFCDRIEPDGFLVACRDDPAAAALAARQRAAGRQVIGYGTAPDAEVRITGIAQRGLRTTFTVAGAGEFTVPVPGEHNARNATAVLAVARALGWPDEAVRAGLAGFHGAARRFEAKGEAGGVAVYDSYAHHPTELAADLRAAREVVRGTGGQVLVVFQPHLYSRTRLLAADLGAALGLADRAVVLDVYGAREDPEPGVTGALVADAVPGGATYLPDAAAAVDSVADMAGPGDLVLTMGAGDVTRLGPAIVARLGG